MVSVSLSLQFSLISLKNHSNISSIHGYRHFVNSSGVKSIIILPKTGEFEKESSFRRKISFPLANAGAGGRFPRGRLGFRTPPGWRAGGYAESGYAPPLAPPAGRWRCCIHAGSRPSAS